MATVGQRIKAAQAQAGGITVTEIASKPGRPTKFSAKTLGRVIQGKRTLEPHEAEWLAGALGVEPDFFFADEPAPEPLLERIEQRVADLLAAHGARVEALLRDQERRLKAQDGLLREQSVLIHDMRSTLNEIRAAVASDDRLRDEIEAATRRLLAVAAAVATRALEAEAPSPVEAPDTSAK
jgi:transcriptional regulator with XRE-family HTH domain